VVPSLSPSARIPHVSVVCRALFVGLLVVPAVSLSDYMASRTFALGFGARLGRFGEGGRSASSAATSGGCARGHLAIPQQGGLTYLL
jgi:hypothetical protein